MASKKDRLPRKISPEPAPVLPAKPPMEWRRHTFTVMTVWALALAAYSNSFRGELAYDSQVIVQDDPRLRAASPGNLGLIWSRGYWFDNNDPTLYRPLTTLSYLFNYSILGNGARPAGYHWINFILHAIDTLLVYALGILIFRDKARAAALAALWGVHPVLTESVTNIVGRADLLATLGVLAGLLCHVKAAAATGTRRLGWLTGLGAAAAIGIFSKESAIVLVVLMLVYDVAYRKAEMKGFLAAYAVAALPMAVFLYRRGEVLATLPIHFTLFVNNPLVGAGFWQAKFTAVQVLGRYMAMILWPQYLSCDYSYNQIPLFRGTFDHWGDWATILALFACLAAAGLAARGYRRSRPVFFFMALFFLALAPVANIAMPIGTIMAERFLYLPAVGFMGCAVWAIYASVVWLSRRWPTSAIQPMWVVGLLCLALLVRTHVRNADWENSVTLWDSGARVASGSYKTHLNLAVALFKAKISPDRMIPEAERSMDILATLPPDKDEDPSAYANIGAIYRSKGEMAAKGQSPDSAAISGQWYRKALATLLRGAAIERRLSADAKQRNEAAGRPPWPFGMYQIYQELGQAYLRAGEPQKAIDALDYGIRIRPDPQFFQILSEAYAALPDRDGAAIALMEGQVMYPENQAFASELLDLYQKWPASCAVNRTGGAAGLNIDCPLVHDHLCAGARRVSELYQRRGRAVEAERTRNTAVQSLGCPAQ